MRPEQVSQTAGVGDDEVRAREGEALERGQGEASHALDEVAAPDAHVVAVGRPRVPQVHHVRQPVRSAATAPTRCTVCGGPLEISTSASCSSAMRRVVLTAFQNQPRASSGKASSQETSSRSAPSTPRRGCPPAWNWPSTVGRRLATIERYTSFSVRRRARRWTTTLSLRSVESLRPDDTTCTSTPDRARYFDRPAHRMPPMDGSGGK